MEDFSPSFEYILIFPATDVMSQQIVRKVQPAHACLQFILLWNLQADQWSDDEKGERPGEIPSKDKIEERQIRFLLAD